MSDHAKPAYLSPRDVARLTGVSTDTLRHYETRGVLPAPSRSPAGYRRYPPDTVTRVQLIQRALRIGFSIEDLTTVYRQRDRGGAPCQRVHRLVAEQLRALDRQIVELNELRKDLSVLLEQWAERLPATPPGRQARLLDMLADSPSLTRHGARAAASGELLRCATSDNHLGAASHGVDVHVILAAVFGRRCKPAMVPTAAPKTTSLRKCRFSRIRDAARRQEATVYTGTAPRQPRCRSRAVATAKVSAEWPEGKWSSSAAISAFATCGVFDRLDDTFRHGQRTQQVHAEMRHLGLVSPAADDIDRGAHGKQGRRGTDGGARREDVLRPPLPDQMRVHAIVGWMNRQGRGTAHGGDGQILFPGKARSRRSGPSASP